MSEYIDRKKLREDLKIGCDCLHCDCSNCLGSEFEVACKAINEQPTVDLQPVRHGKWLPVETETGIVTYGVQCITQP